MHCTKFYDLTWTVDFIPRWTFFISMECHSLLQSLNFKEFQGFLNKKHSLDRVISCVVRQFISVNNSCLFSVSRSQSVIICTVSFTSFGYRMRLLRSCPRLFSPKVTRLLRPDPRRTMLIRSRKLDCSNVHGYVVVNSRCSRLELFSPNFWDYLVPRASDVMRYHCRILRICNQFLVCELGVSPDIVSARPRDFNLRTNLHYAASWNLILTGMLVVPMKTYENLILSVADIQYIDTFFSGKMTFLTSCCLKGSNSRQAKKNEIYSKYV